MSVAWLTSPVPRRVKLSVAIIEAVYTLCNLKFPRTNSVSLIGFDRNVLVVNWLGVPGLEPARMATPRGVVDLSLFNIYPVSCADIR